MDVLLCATRGGEASIQTQEQAIEIAKERGARIIFIFVSDVRFLDIYSAPRVPAMEDEMQHLGEFLLLMAKERAEKAGVDADFTVRQGDFKAALIAAAEEHGASLIVLGRPADDSLTTLDYLENELSPAIKEATGIETIVV
ncbi:MAG: universal stress protein [Anaerolineae bacterium]|jgi:nucleotide-binding universal stress UspA family protein|nr:universal stress protein [Anaerolineae bacterium]